MSNVSYALLVETLKKVGADPSAVATALKSDPRFTRGTVAGVRKLLGQYEKGAAILAALDAPSQQLGRDPLEELLGQAQTLPKAPPKAPPKASKGSKGSKTKKVDRSHPVYREAHRAAKGRPAAEYKVLYNAHLVAQGFPPFYG